MKNKLLMLVMGIILIGSFSFVYADIIWSDGTITEFEITSINPVCDYEKFVWKTWDSVSEELVEENSLEDCFRDEGWPSTTCCPEENECILDPVDIEYGKCAGPASPQFCWDYTSERYGGDEDRAEAQCGGFAKETAKRSMEESTGIENICSGYKESDVILGETCWRTVFNCRCEWDDAEDVCVAKASRSNWICPGDTELTTDGNCSFAEISKQDDCDNSGYILYSWAAAWEDGASETPDWCVDNQRKIRCAAKLFFFTITSLIIAIILIVIVYLVWIKKKEKVRKKRKK